VSLRQFNELRRKPYHPIRMASLYLTAVGTTNFIHASIARDFENAPPIILFGLVRGLLSLPLTLSLSLALLLGLLPPLLGLSFSFDLSLNLAPMSFIPSLVGFSLLFSLPPTFGVLCCRAKAA